MRRQAEPAAADTPPLIVPATRLAPTESTRRWAVLLQQIFEVDPLACPTCHGAMRIVAFITQTSVIDQILTHLRTRAAHATHAGLGRDGEHVNYKRVERLYRLEGLAVRRRHRKRVAVPRVP